MATKKRAIQFRKKDGSELVEYWVLTYEGYIKTCPPSVWHKLKLEDVTSEKEKEKSADIRYKSFINKRNFGRKVEDLQFLRTLEDKSKQFQALCERHKLIF